SVLLALQRPAPALADLDQLLAVDPAADPARFQRALTLAGLERPGEALEDFLELSRRRPEKVESWANAGMILLRMERYAEAIPHLRRATQMSPANMRLRRSLANALSGNGALAEAMPLFESVVRATPRDPAALTDYAMALMSAGRPRDALAQLLAALRVDPTAQTALEGLYLSGNELGMGELVDQLMDYPRLLSPTPRPEGIALDREALRAAVLAHPGLVWQPAGRSTWQGRPSPMLELSPGSPSAALGAVVRHEEDERPAAARAGTALRGGPRGAARSRPGAPGPGLAAGRPLDLAGAAEPHAGPVAGLALRGLRRDGAARGGRAPGRRARRSGVARASVGPDAADPLA